MYLFELYNQIFYSYSKAFIPIIKCCWKNNI